MDTSKLVTIENGPDTVMSLNAQKLEPTQKIDTAMQTSRQRNRKPKPKNNKEPLPKTATMNRPVPCLINSQKSQAENQETKTHKTANCKEIKNFLLAS